MSGVVVQPGHVRARTDADTAEPSRATLRAKSGRENFLVLSPLVERRHRAHLSAVYAFCRAADDIADEHDGSAEARSAALAVLGEWHRELDRCAGSGSGSDRPIFAELGATIRELELDVSLFHRLLDAFEQDQRVTRYEHLEQVLGYCRNSADPVGRIVLSIVAPERASDPGVLELSDRVCTGLQLANHWQDVRRDLLERDRIYLPLEEIGLDEPTLRAWASGDGARGRRATGDAERFAAALRPLCAHAAGMFASADALPGLLGGRTGRLVWLFGAAGQRVLDAIERIGHRTLWKRPRVGAMERLSMLGRAVLVPTPVGSFAGGLG